MISVVRIDRSVLAKKASAHLESLCTNITNRRMGSSGNRAATDYFARKMEGFGFTVESPEFVCMDWVQEGAWLTAEGSSYPVFPSPYTLGCDISAPLRVVSTEAELGETSADGSVLLVHGELAREQLMPKNFTFYNPDHHKRIIELLERRRPLAIVAATTKDPGMAGAVSPFPLIEDGDFDIPSVYMTAADGLLLAGSADETASLRILAERIPSTGCNVIARIGDFPKERVVLFAHIDSKDGTRGAIDNATGVVILLLLGELLEDYQGAPRIEIVSLNGEDYYAASGEVQYLAANEGKFDEILLGINFDGAGYFQGRTAVSLYDCPTKIDQIIRKLIAKSDELVEGPHWYQSDHSLFLMNGRPALAFTSDRMEALWTEVAHTEQDTPEIVDPVKLADVAMAAESLLRQLA